MDPTAMFLLKLHGSLNWRLKTGYSAPYAIDAVVHHKLWFSDQSLVTPEDIESHLDREAFIVSPVRSKSKPG